jgi:alanine racemase
LLFHKNKYSITVPFTDAASIENAMHCISYLLIKQYSEKQLNIKWKQIQPVALRLEQKKGQHNCIIVNDSYSNDWNSLIIALDYLNQHSSKYKKTIVLSDMQQSDIANSKLYKQVADLLVQKKITKLIAVGPTISTYQKYFSSINEPVFLQNTEDAKKYCTAANFTNEIILFKGARSFALETVAQQLEEKVHQTILEINIEKIVHNIKAHQKRIDPTTKIMAIVKAFGYGSGSVEVAQLLQQQGVAYLAVAYTDEGVALRKAGIHLPIMVMNTDSSAFDTLIEYDLEPEIFSIGLLESFLLFAKKNALSNYPIHLKLDTGMHRLGFVEKDVTTLCEKLQRQNIVTVQTIFSHLVGSEDKSFDAFTKKQNQLFEKMATIIEKAIGYITTKHIGNSAAIDRHPHLQHQMVRLGIGMYGVTNNDIGLQQVCTLKTTIAQIKFLDKGDTVGYNRKGKIQQLSKIATIRIGYADGYSRRLGNGVGKVLVNNILAPIIGNVCMDMTMIDITNIPNVQEGDYVTIFGEALPVKQLANWCNTIPYEILTGISERVKRVYIEN